MTINGASNFGIRDNHSRGTVADFIKDKIAAGSDLSVVSAYFTIYAYEALSTELDKVERLRFLFGEPRFIASLDPEKTDKKSFKIEDEGLELANRLQQKEIARRCAAWISACDIHRTAARNGTREESCPAVFHGVTQSQACGFVGRDECCRLATQTRALGQRDQYEQGGAA